MKLKMFLEMLILDYRVTDPLDFTSVSPGANDNASGVAGVIEAAMVIE